MVSACAGRARGRRAAAAHLGRVLLEPDRAGQFGHEVHGGLGLRVVPDRHGARPREWRQHDGGARLAGQHRQPLEQLLRHVRHEWVEQPQAVVQACVQHGLGCVLGGGVGHVGRVEHHHRLDGLQVHVAQLPVPKVVGGGRGGRDLVSRQQLIHSLGGLGEARQDPGVGEQRQVHFRLALGVRHQTHGYRQRRRPEGRLRGHVAARLLRRVEVQEGEACCVPQLVAEVAVGHHAVDVQVDVAALPAVREQAEAQRVGAALGDALRVFLLVHFFGRHQLLGVDVAWGGHRGKGG
eukprot:scaffold3013_cov113-Isochrysis_galbana.AAC.5